MPTTHIDRQRRLKRIRRRNIIMNTICTLLVIAGILWIVGLFWRYVNYETTNDAVIDQYISPVSIRVSGYVKEVRFTEHQPVRAGDTLLILDDSEYRIRLKDAVAALMDARGARGVLGTGIETSMVNVSVQDANIVETKARLWQLEQDYKRYANLLAEESVTQQQYEQVNANYEAMKARYEALIRQKSLAESQSSEISGKTTGADALIMRREADLEMAQLNLSYTVVTAPYDGYTGRRTLEVGQLVQAGQTLTYMVRGNDKWVTANYKETQIRNVFIGQMVRIRVDAFPMRTFHGTIKAISEATGSKYSLVPTDNSAGNFVKIQQRIPVRIEFDDASDEDMTLLRAGMMVQVEADKH